MLPVRRKEFERWVALKRRDGISVLSLILDSGNPAERVRQVVLEQMSSNAGQNSPAPS